VSLYKRMLVAVDLEADSLRVGQRARELAAALGADLRMVHVVTPVLVSVPMPPEPVAPDGMVDMVELARQAQRQMAGLARELDLPDDSWEVLEGNIRDEILRAARERSADLIVIGSRERHGLAMLLRPTEAAVTHRAPCDVLEVRLLD
jgi:universal stress protein A